MMEPFSHELSDLSSTGTDGKEGNTTQLYVESDTDRSDIQARLPYLFDPNHRPYRYYIAILLSLAYGAAMYIPDLPAGIQATIIQVMRLDNVHYFMIFSAYTWADTAMAFLGSLVVNQFLGIHAGFIVFLGLIAVGQLTCTVGCFVNSFWVYFIGRIVVGSGVGTSSSIINSFQVLGFDGKEITFIMSLTKSAGRLTATAALFTPQLLYESLSTTFLSLPYYRLGITQLFGTCVILLGIMFALGVVLLDKCGAKITKRKPTMKNAMKIRFVLNFPVSFWLVVAICTLYYSVIVSFTGNGSLFFISKYGMNVRDANLANSLSYGTTIILTPFVAIFIDWIGYHLLWGLAGALLAVAAYLLTLTSEMNAYIPYTSALIVSLSFTLFGTAMWVVPSFIVNKNQVTTAYGTLMSLYAVGVSVFGVTAGVVVDHSGYFVLLVFYVAILVTVSLSIVCLSLSEIYSNKRILNISGKDRRKRIEVHV